ncbi:MAG: phasin family protein [Xanthomonadales bacterium]|nr:phasin family protein [Xanthomonadales bacterium]
MNAKRQSHREPATREPLLRRIAYAGLGALSLVQHRGRALLAELVEEGRRFGARGQDAARELGSTLGDRAAGLRALLRGRLEAAGERIGQAIEDLSSGLLERAGIPSRRELSELSRRIAELNRQLAELGR